MKSGQHLLLPAALVLAAAVSGCQSVPTRERPPLELDGAVTSRLEEGAPADACRVSARFGLVVRQPVTGGEALDAGTAWASGGDSGSVDVWVATDQQVVGIQEPQPALTKPYAGVMVIEWSVDGQRVDATSATAAPEAALSVDGSDDDGLWARFVEVDQRWRRAGRAFRFTAPAAPRRAVVTGRATWRSGGQQCESRTTFVLHWLAPEVMPAFPDEVPLPQPFARDVLEHRPGDRRRHVAHSGVYVVTPLRYVWSVASTTGCCGSTNPYRVIQFARAVLESDVPALRRRRPWGLDVAPSQKDDANAREAFDPGLTQRPGQSETQIDKHVGAKPAISHWDGPGMSEVRYRQLLLTPGRHVLHQQFLSLLVCGNLRGSRADRLLDHYGVVKAVLFNLTWTFDGAVDSPTRVRVSTDVRARADLACRSLRSVLEANGLAGAFRSPPPAELLRVDEHGSELRSLLDLATIGVPP